MGQRSLSLLVCRRTCISCDLHRDLIELLYSAKVLQYYRWILLSCRLWCYGLNFISASFCCRCTTIKCLIATPYGQWRGIDSARINVPDDGAALLSNSYDGWRVTTHQGGQEEGVHSSARFAHGKIQNMEAGYTKGSRFTYILSHTQEVRLFTWFP